MSASPCSLAVQDDRELAEEQTTEVVMLPEVGGQLCNGVHERHTHLVQTRTEGPNRACALLRHNRDERGFEREVELDIVLMVADNAEELDLQLSEVVVNLREGELHGECHMTVT